RPEGGGEHAASDRKRGHPPPARHRWVLVPHERHGERDEHRPDEPPCGQTRTLGEESSQQRTHAKNDPAYDGTHRPCSLLVTLLLRPTVGSSVLETRRPYGRR